MYSLNDYNGEIKGLKKNIKLFRGLTMSYINLSFYERNVDNIITFPSLTSCSTDEDIAKCFCGRKKSHVYPDKFYPVKKWKKDGKFSVLIIIDYEYKNDWVPSAFSVSDLSVNEYENEFIFQPFSFFKIQDIKIDFEKYEANIFLNNVGKKKF